MHQEKERFYYSSSFQHLTDVQQRQVGAILGAAVGDAAVRAVEGATEAAIAAALEGGAHEGEVAFLPAAIAPTTIPMRVPLAKHSLAFEAMSALLETVAASKTTLDAADLGTKLWPTTRTLLPRMAAAEASGESSLYDAAVVVPIAALYPYADEGRVEMYLQEVWRALHDPALVEAGETAEGFRRFEEGTAACASPVHGSQLLATATTATLMRFMIRNPDAIKNASFRCAPGVRSIFACAPGFQAANAALEVPPFAARALADAATVMHTTRNSRSFAEGIRAVARAGGRGASHKGMLVGALLGARFGVRAIPDEWLRATDGADVMTRQALEVSTWAWNAPVV